MMVGGKESDGLTFEFETISPVLSLIGTIGPRGDLGPHRTSTYKYTGRQKSLQPEGLDKSVATDEVSKICHYSVIVSTVLVYNAGGSAWRRSSIAAFNIVGIVLGYR